MKFVFKGGVKTKKYHVYATVYKYVFTYIYIFFLMYMTGRDFDDDVDVDDDDFFKIKIYSSMSSNPEVRRLMAIAIMDSLKLSPKKLRRKS